MSWIQTYTGKKVFPLAIQGYQVCIEDIAHALALKCRFTGHCREFYSIAEHSVRVSQIVRPELKLAALLHDAAEAYLPDFAAPIKGAAFFRLKGPTDDWGPIDPVHGQGSELKLKANLRGDQRHAIVTTGLYGANVVENVILSVVHAVFGVSGYSAAAIKHADLILLATEARDLLGPPPEDWNLDVPVLPVPIKPWPWEQAKREFLDRFAEYSGSGKTGGAS